MQTSVKLSECLIVRIYLNGEIVYMCFGVFYVGAFGAKLTVVFFDF